MYYNKKELIYSEVRASDNVLDVGFLGQGVREGSDNWPHALLKARAREVYGVDLELTGKYAHDDHYRAMSAEEFSFPVAFDCIFAGDLIEHLSNPGLFLECCKKNLAQGGRLIITTPNAFNLFNLAEKLTKREPTVNADHTCYFNSKTLRALLEKNGMEASKTSFLYNLGYEYAESWKKKFLNILYWFASRFTDKFIETLVVVATVQQ
jgi:2-polyprenyl-3-methyl-5-hydroxy-6-metoxy-1,4-benzoquinol methylase